MCCADRLNPPSVAVFRGGPQGALDRMLEPESSARPTAEVNEHAAGHLLFLATSLPRRV